MSPEQLFKWFPITEGMELEPYRMYFIAKSPRNFTEGAFEHLGEAIKSEIKPANDLRGQNLEILLPVQAISLKDQIQPLIDFLTQVLKEKENEL